MQRAEIRVTHMRRRRQAGMGPAPSRGRSRESVHPRSATHVAAYPIAIASPNSTSRAAATGARSIALAQQYASPHPGVLFRNGSAGDGRWDRGGWSSERNANGSASHTDAASSAEKSPWLYAWPLATPRVVVGMESERRGVDREAMDG
jgi:hypothetical protein